MARPLRVEYPGAFYHVISRGNGGERIFRTESDYTKLLEYLGKATERFAVTVYTYCLMSNHYHLLIETPQPNLSTGKGLSMYSAELAQKVVAFIEADM